MKLSQLLEVTPAINALAGTKLPAKTGYRLGKWITLVKAEEAEFHAARNKLLQELGTAGEANADGSMPFSFTAENGKQFVEQQNALSDEEVDTASLPTITPDDLGSAEIEPHHLAALDGIIIKEAT